jgi:hypothetical protein
MKLQLEHFIGCLSRVAQCRLPSFMQYRLSRIMQYQRCNIKNWSIRPLIRNVKFVEKTNSHYDCTLQMNESS